uniref:Uncharacterized protein n=1 Tax=Anguilla anguilla TaxID=7936 RepID=A0A0E9W7F3_ANGAN
MFCNDEVMFPCLYCTLRRMGSSIPGGSMCLLIFASTSNPWLSLLISKTFVLTFGTRMGLNYDSWVYHQNFLF